MSYQVEMLWECSLCNKQGNLGLKDRYCKKCGHKKDATDREYFPEDISEAAALKGEDELKAKAGADRICRYCDAVQNQRNKHCGNCGADDMGNKLQGPPELAEATSRVDTEAPVAKSIMARIGKPPWQVLVFIAAAAVFSWLLVWLFIPRVVVAEVSSFYWKHDVVIDRYAVHVHEGWYAGAGSFDVQPLGMRHHHYDRVATGSHQEHYTESYTCGQRCANRPSSTVCTKNNNGTANCRQVGGGTSCVDKTCTRPRQRTVIDYTNVSRQQMWYGWRAWEWAHHRTITKEGHSKEPFWPKPEELRAPLAEGEQERQQPEFTYWVTFKDAEGSAYKHSPHDLSSFMSYELGDPYKLKVTRAGDVEVLGGYE